jgi:hypothetical protein
MVKPATHVASVLLAVVSLAHLLRVVFGTQVTVADAVIPMWVSAVAFVVAGGVAFLLWREAGRR